MLAATGLSLSERAYEKKHCDLSAAAISRAKDSDKNFIFLVSLENWWEMTSMATFPFWDLMKMPGMSIKANESGPAAKKSIIL